MAHRGDHPKLDRRQLVALGAGLAVSATGYAGQSGQSSQRAPSMPPSVPRSMAFRGIDTIVMLMMENRSFDHYFGMLGADPTYPGAASVGGLTGREANTDADGNRVTPYHLSSFTQTDPPHSWEACHEQWGEGRNDGFVRAHAGPQANEVMGYFSRAQLPMSYWLADHFTLCDHWYASVLGPTWPNRTIMHATTAAGLKTNAPLSAPPKTIWEALADVGLSGKNYYAGLASFYSGAFLGKLLSGINPTVGIDQFFADAAAGTLPHVAFVDPDFGSNDDHPSHSVHLGQAFIASIYAALAQSPQWSRTLFVITYDEHGGFYDHAAPPPCADEDPEFAQLGFRVPALVIGPTVRRGAVCHDQLEHCSLAATARSCFGMPSLSTRMSQTADLAGCIDPEAVDNPRRPPANPPVIDLRESQALTQLRLADGQPELTAMVDGGQIPRAAVSPLSSEERLALWLRQAQRLGVVRL